VDPVDGLVTDHRIGLSTLVVAEDGAALLLETGDGSLIDPHTTRGGTWIQQLAEAAVDSEELEEALSNALPDQSLALEDALSAIGDATDTPVDRGDTTGAGITSWQRR